MEITKACVRCGRSFVGYEPYHLPMSEKDRRDRSLCDDCWTVVQRADQLLGRVIMFHFPPLKRSDLLKS